MMLIVQHHIYWTFYLVIDVLITDDVLITGSSDNEATIAREDDDIKYNKYDLNYLLSYLLNVYLIIDVLLITDEFEPVSE